MVVVVKEMGCVFKREGIACGGNDVSDCSRNFVFPTSLLPSPADVGTSRRSRTSGSDVVTTGIHSAPRVATVASVNLRDMKT